MLLIPILAMVFLALIVFCCDKKYRETSYYKCTKQSYLSVLHNPGRYGEYLAYKKLAILEKCGAKFLFNLYIPKSNGGTTEIDMLMITPKGIFVFEIKNYSGWIFGDENQKNWYQTLPAGKRSHKEVFYNPIMQNESHVNHLIHFLEGSAPLEVSTPVYSIVVFSDHCTFMNVQVNSFDVGLVHLSQLNQFVSDVLNQNNENVSGEYYAMEFYNKLYSCSQVSEVQKAQHVQEIQFQKNAHCNDFSTDDQHLRCPKCGGTLVLRTSKKEATAGNQFYGCSNYPKCRYVRNVK